MGSYSPSNVCGIINLRYIAKDRWLPSQKGSENAFLKNREPAGLTWLTM